MKKLITILLCFALIFAFTACGKKQNGIINEAQEKSDVNIDSLDLDFTDNDRDASFENGIAVNGQSTFTIKDGKTYVLSGEYKQIIVDSSTNDKPKIVLNGAVIASSEGPAIYIKNADKVFITVTEGTKNTLSDTTNYPSDYDNSDAVIFSKDDLTINGKGELFINGNYKCGIASKDDLVICDTVLTVNSKGTAIEGKDCVKITNAKITVTAETDGIKATNEEAENLGYVYIQSGNYVLNTTKDGLQAASSLLIDNGSFNITTGGGSENSSDKQDGNWGHWGGFNQSSTTTASAKALKATKLIKVTNGSFEVNSSDDAIHSNSDIEINGGDFNISSGDDGVHADDSLIINGGSFKISKSYEGIEATVITVNNGEIDLTASDDGFNAAGGNDSSSIGDRPGRNPFESDSAASINITGGTIVIDASGDGIDSNGSVSITGGTTYVNGPTNNGNGAFDYGSSATISGGSIILVGASGMSQGFSEASAQPSIYYNLSTAYQGGTKVAICDKNGKELFGFTSSKQFNSVVISCEKLELGNDYILKIGTNEYNISLTSTVFSNGNSQGGMGGGMGRPGGMGGGRPQKPW